MRSLKIKPQPKLGLIRILKLTLTGIRYRLFRSVITLMVIVVAVAFLMNILSEGLIKRSVYDQTKDRIRDMRQATTWSARLSIPGTHEEILQQLAASAGATDPMYKEISVMAGIAGADMESFKTHAQEATLLLDFFHQLDYGWHQRLVGTAAGTDIFDELQDSKNLSRFQAVISETQAPKVPVEQAPFTAFLKQWPALKARTDTVRKARLAAIAKVAEALDGKTLMKALATVEGGFGETVRQAGFFLDQKTAVLVAAQTRIILDLQFLEGAAGRPKVRALIAAKFDLATKDLTIDKFWKILGDRATADWFADAVRENWWGIYMPSPEWLQQLARKKKAGTIASGAEHMDEFLLSTCLDEPGLKAAAAAYLKRDPAEVGRDAIWDILTTQKGADWFSAAIVSATDDDKKKPIGTAAKAVLKEEISDHLMGAVQANAQALKEWPLSAAKISATGADRKEIQQLLKVQGLGDELRGGFMGIGERTAWLLLVSLLVCAVGICNAMLMSVTERFREIATLKCLGQLDSSIMIMFVMEASILGFVGGIIGSCLGCVIALGRLTASFGMAVPEAVSPVEMLWSILLCTAAGMLLSAFAAIYPSFKAARLAPMEAMRID